MKKEKYSETNHNYEPEIIDFSAVNEFNKTIIFDNEKGTYIIQLKRKKEKTRKLKQNPLEKILQSLEKERINELRKSQEKYQKPYRPSIKYPSLEKTLNETTHINTETGAQVNYVSPSELPSGYGWRALGMYDPSTHTIYIANNLSRREHEFVYAHEEAHATGIIDEDAADAYAARRVGYNLRSEFKNAA